MSEEEFLKDTWAGFMAGELLDMLKADWTEAERLTHVADLHDALLGGLEAYLDKAQASEREAAGAPPTLYWTPSIN